MTTKLFGPKYRLSRESIEIDITYQCNLKCINCNRSCRQAPTSQQITIKQIQKFIKESIDNNMEWKRIRLTGGEPALHPHILEILNLLLEYKKRYSPHTRIQLVTNGFAKTVNDILPKVPRGIEVENSLKESEVQIFGSFNLAPQDSIIYKHTDYSNGCLVISVCGMGLTPHGYYPCAIAGSIDRVFGFDVGRKKMPSPGDPMLNELQTFCRFCGHFGYTKYIISERISSTWRMAYEKYKAREPILSLY